MWNLRLKEMSLLFLVSVLASCAVVHKRGPQAQVMTNHFEKEVDKAKDCAKQAASAAGERLEGEIILEWKVNDQGETLEATLAKNSTGLPEVGDCWLGYLKSLKFPKTPLWTHVSATYVQKYRLGQSSGIQEIKEDRPRETEK